MFFLSVKALVPAITLFSVAIARSTHSVKYNDTLPAYHTGHKHTNTTLPWVDGKGKGKGEDKVTVVTVVIKKPVTTICVTETSGSKSGSVYTYSTYTGPGPVSSKPSSPTKAGYTTSTLLSTVTYTITSCAPTVTKCPVGLVTETVYTYTTVCPVSEASSSSFSSAPYKNASTIASSSSSATFTASGTVTLSSSSGSVTVPTSSSLSSGSVSLSSSGSVSVPTSSSVTSESISVSSTASTSSSLLSSSTSSSEIPSSSSSTSVILSSSSLSSTESSSSVVPTSSSSSSATLSSSSTSSVESSSSSTSVGPSSSSSSTSSEVSSSTSSTSSQVSPTSSTSSVATSSSSTETRSSSVTPSSSSSLSTSSSVASSSSTTSSSSLTSSSPSSSSSSSSSSSLTSSSSSVSSSSTISSSSSSSSSLSSSSSQTSSSSLTSSSSSSSIASSSSITSSSSSSLSSSSSIASTTSSTSSSTSSSLSSSSSTSSSSSSSATSTSSSLSSSSKSSSSSTVSSTSSSLSSSSTSSSSSSSSSSITSSSSSSSKTSSTSSSTSSSATPTPTLPVCYYWMENFKHQGIAPFAAAPGTYQVFRNVKDFGAKGDGITDDTAAINLAISTGNRCAPGQCESTTTTPAVVYFPSGTYLVSSPIIDYYYTQMIGNPNCMPVIKGSSSFTARWVVDANVYQPGGALGYGATNLFWRQMRNFVIDLTSIPAAVSVAGIHWPTAQATSLQNIVFQMSAASGTQHEGVFVEQGSGGFMTDLVFHGGLHGALFANQQFTMRNLTFYNAVTAISQAFDWGWTYKGLSINNCGVGINMSAVGSDGVSLSVGSITLLDSVFTNTPIGIATGKSATSVPPTANSLIIENVQFNNVPTIVSGAGNTVLLAGSGGSINVAGWGQGHSYSGTTGPSSFSGAITPNARTGLTAGADFYERSKPQYEKLPTSSFVSVRDAGAKGDGVTDDSDVLNSIIAAVAAAGKIIYFDAGDYLVTKTIYIPAGSRITGETYPVILSSGAFFNDINNPKPVVQVGKAGETGTVEWSDMIVSTKGAQAGAILIEWNLASSSTPAGMWDVHTRIGGFAGSDLQLANCPKTPDTVITSANLPAQCIAAFMSMHITSTATGLYMENVWLWVADHDVEDPTVTQITVYAGRGLLIESTLGSIWLYGTAVEHHTLYQYQLVNTANIVLGQIQTETAYYQPNPSSPIPFPIVAAYSDPTIAAGASGWGVRVVNSKQVLVYGAGLYSFFSNYNVHCSDQGNGETCQSRIFSVEQSTVSVYNLNTVGTGVMITKDGVDVAKYSDNLNGFVDTVALYRS